MKPYPDRIEQQIYAFFGYKPELAGLTSAKEILALLLQEVPESQAAQRERLLDDCDEMVGALVDTHCTGKSEESWALDELGLGIKGIFGFEPKDLESAQNPDELVKRIYDQVEEVIAKREKEMGKDVLVTAFRHFYLRQIDKQWLEHLAGMEHLRSGIGLRGYGNRDPKQEYKREGYDMFTEMMGNIKSNVLENTFHVAIENKEDAQRISMPRQNRRTSEGRGGEGGAPREKPQKPQTVKREQPKVGRNDPCPCGSGKKYKKCHGK